MIVSIAIVVLPVWRSPMISSRWPRPIGIILSIALIPVCSGTLTLWRWMMPRAIASTGRISLVSTGPLPSMGAPRAFTTRPSRSSPTGTERASPVRNTELPSWMVSLSDRIATETVSSSRFWATPKLPSSNRSSSLAMQERRPYTVAIPSPTVMTVPFSFISILVSYCLICSFMILLISPALELMRSSLP